MSCGPGKLSGFPVSTPANQSDSVDADPCHVNFHVDVRYVAEDILGVFILFYFHFYFLAIGSRRDLRLSTYDLLLVCQWCKTSGVVKVSPYSWYDPEGSYNLWYQLTLTLDRNLCPSANMATSMWNTLLTQFRKWRSQ